MTFEKRLKSTSKLFIASVVGVVLLAIAGMGLALYSAEVITFDKETHSQDLRDLSTNNPELTNYLEQQKEYEAHFISIANLISQDKKSSITMAFIYSAVPITIISALAAYFVARRLLQPVKEAYESQERFLQDAAHELRNPIAAINLALENSAQNMTPAKQKKLIVMIGRQTRRLVRINEDLLFLEKRQTIGKDIPHTNISELLEDVIEGFQITLNKRHIRLKTAIENKVEKQIRPNDFVKLSRNIIENAIKYSADNSQVEVTLANANRLEFVVKDNGIGIPSKDIDKLGERFFRASNVNKFEGSGLGIAIVYKIANTYGASVDIDSKVGKGTTVKIKF